MHSPLLKNRFKSKQLSDKSSSKSPKIQTLEISPKKIKSSEDVM